MIKKIEFSFSELQIVPEEIEVLMGFEPGHSPDPFPELMEEALRLAPERCRIFGGYQIFKRVIIDPVKERLQIENQEFCPGKIVVTQLKEAVQAAVLVATAGSGITELARQKTAEGDELMAYVLDITGSVTVEKAATKIMDQIFVDASSQGAGITDSFSPGYCNWSVDEQQKLFSLIPHQFCGITLSDSSLMNPIKSISAITGIGTNCKQTGYQCNWCPDQQCIYGIIRRRKKMKKNC
ncbi:MAG: hypothetical protein PHS40_12120 [Mariniphaga sp.]|nr:hypothetical protein [Mariniphaga sp.]